MQIALTRSSRVTTPRRLESLRLERAVRRCLDQSGYPQLRSVVCRCFANTAVLTGQVPSYYLKQVAQVMAGKTDGVEQIDDLLEVVKDDEPEVADWS